MLKSNILLPLLLLLTTPAHTQQKCYLMDGKEATTHTPCNPSAEHSGCCFLNHDDPASGDLCLASGLCLSANNLIYESGCTDPTWESDDCPSLCPDMSNGWRGSAGGDWKPGEERQYWQVMACSGGKVCCRASGDGESCCEKDLMKDFIVGTPVYPGSTVVAASEATGTVMTETATTTVVATRTGAPSCVSVAGADEEAAHSGGGDGECTGEVKVGAAVGASLGAALIGTLVALAFMVNRQKKLLGTVESYKAAHAQMRAYSSPVEVKSMPIMELENTRTYERRPELGTA